MHDSRKETIFMTKAIAAVENHNVVGDQTGTGHKAALTAGFLGWMLDAFDFFLVVFSLTAIAHDFHSSDRAIAFSITLTLAFRPVGAFIFGALSDKYGRRGPLMLAVILYSIIEVLSGLATNLTTFVILRGLFGIAMGGEWGVGASLAMEAAPTKRRGFLSGILQQGYPAGYLLAAICYAFIFPRFGWRPLFFLGGLPALLALYVRFHIKESQVWKETRQATWKDFVQVLAIHWKLLIYIALFMAGLQLTAHGTQDMYPTFLERYWHFGPSERAWITAVSMIAAILGGILIGYLSDRWGRRRMIVVALTIALLAIPMWAFALSRLGLIMGAVIMQFLIQGAMGVVPAHLSELSPNSVRGFLVGFGYQCGVLLSSSVVFVEATLANHISYPWAMAGTAVIVLLLAILGTAVGPERHATIFSTKIS
jgi:SHS family lactate transporter-like MFS transporter